MADLTVSANVDSFMQAANYAAMRTLLNVEDGATADQTGAEIDAALDTLLGHTNWTLDWEASGVGTVHATNIPDLSGTYQPLDGALTALAGGALDADLDVAGFSLVSSSNGDITLTPNGTGDVVLGNYTLDADATVGASQDNYVMTYDHSAGKWGPEASAGGGGLTNWEESGTTLQPTTAGYDLGAPGNEVGDIVTNGQIFLPNGVAANPSIAFTSDPDSGIYFSSGIRMVYGANQAAFFTNTQSYLKGTDVRFGTNAVYFDASVSDVWSQVNGTTAQEFRLYETTDSSYSNYIRAYHKFDGSNNYLIGIEDGGTESGNAGEIKFVSDNRLILEAPSQSYIALRSGNNDSTGFDTSAVRYNFSVNNGTRFFTIAQNGIYPYSNAAIGLGAATSGFGYLYLTDKNADPTDPGNGMMVMWQSDGTGSGDDGDIMLKITDSGGTTKTITLVDFSAF